MISTVVTHKAEPEAIDQHNKRSRWMRHAAGAASGLVGGVIFSILGGLLAKVDRTQHLFEFDLGVALLALTLPLLIFGIYSLSWFVDDSTPSHEYPGPVRPPSNLPFSGRRSKLLAMVAIGSLLLLSAATKQAQQTIFVVEKGFTVPKIIIARYRGFGQH